MAKWSFPGKTVLEFFAGIGLVQKALQSTGWRCIYANDIDPKKKEMFEGHYGPSEYYHEGDIWDADSVLGRIAEHPYLATASFPCTDMSLAGKMLGFKGTESSAFFGFLNVLKRLGNHKPQVVLLENVPGFLHSRGGKDFVSAANGLAELGYWLDSFVVDAKWFVPQSRQRLFVVGYHDSIVHTPPIFHNRHRDLFDCWSDIMWSSEDFRPVKLREIFHTVNIKTGWATVESALPQTPSYSLADVIDTDDQLDWWSKTEVRRHLAMMSDYQKQLLREVVHQQTNRVMTAFRRVREGRLRLEVRFDGIAGCLRTPKGGSAKQIAVVVQDGNIRMRWMTPREYARLQGVPDFKLPKNTLQGLFGFGDAVCVPVIEWIDANMLTPVFNATHRGNVIAKRPVNLARHGRPLHRRRAQPRHAGRP